MAGRKRGQAKSKEKTGKKGRKLLQTVIFQIAVYGSAFLSCAILTLHSDVKAAHDFYWIICALSVAAFCASYAAARSKKQQGLLTGFLSTLPMHVLILIVSLTLGRFHADWTILISFVILSLVSMLGGVLAVNHREGPRSVKIKR